jgi:hypothetical protein
VKDPAAERFRTSVKLRVLGSDRTCAKTIEDVAAIFRRVVRDFIMSLPCAVHEYRIEDDCDDLEWQSAPTLHEHD